MTKDGGKQDRKAQQYGVTPQSVDFNDWYNEVVKKADLADNSPVAGRWSCARTVARCGRTSSAGWTTGSRRRGTSR